MRYYFAPMEGLTDSVYRRLHHKYFGGVDRYYMPFLSPTIHRTLTHKEDRELPMADSVPFCAVPQILTKVAEDFLWAAGICRDRGYEEVNLNLGCPSGTVPAGKVFVDGTGVGDVGSVVLRDRKHLAQDGMIVVCVNLSSQDGSVITGPDIITRGFIYVKESEDLMEELREVTLEAIERCQRKRVRDWATIKTAIKNDLSGYLYKTTKRNPMILPVIMEI